MKIFFLKALFWIQLQAGKLLDNIFEIFNVFAGIQEVKVNAQGKVEQMDLLTYFLTNDKVQKTFWALVIIGVAVATVLTLVALGKSMFTKRKAAQICGKYVVGIASSVLVAVCMIAIIAIANFFLFYIDKSFKGANNITVSQSIIENCVEPPIYNVDGTIKNHGGWLDDGEGNYHTIQDVKDAYNKGTISAGNFFGTWKTIFGFEVEENKGDDAIKNDPDNPPNNDSRRDGGMIDINRYNFVMGLFSTITLLIVALTASMGLVSRLFDLVFLMLTGPLLTATIPLDDGAKFKLWRETVISKVFLAYGSVFGINIYLIVLPLITNVSILGANSEALTQLMRLLLLVCGGLTVSAGQILFSRLIGSSAEESRQMTHGMRQLFGGAMATVGMAKGAGRMVFGTRNQLTGKRERGLFQKTFGTNSGDGEGRSGGLFKRTASMGNKSGKLLFGNRYSEPIGRTKNRVGAWKNNKMEGNMAKGGLLGRRGQKIIDNYGSKANYRQVKKDFKAFDKYKQGVDNNKIIRV